MDALSKALAYSLAYLGTVQRESDDDADNDVKALECISALLNDLSPQERASLEAAAKDAIAREQKAQQPNHSLIDGYHSILENLAEQGG
jgi:hypothetical protein